MSQISKFDVLLLMHQIDELLQNRKKDSNTDKKIKKLVTV